MKKISLLFIVAVGLMAMESSCKKVDDSCTNNGCSPNRKVILEIENRNTYLQLDNNSRFYYFLISIKGYDNQFFCRICNLPDSVKQNFKIGSSIIVSGKIKEGCNDYKPTSSIGGLEPCYFEIKNIMRNFNLKNTTIK